MYFRDETKKPHSKAKILIVVLVMITLALGALVILNYPFPTSSAPVKTASTNTTASKPAITTSGTKTNSSITTIIATTTNTTTTARVGKRLMVNDLVASSGDVAFTYFDKSACYYSGRAYDYNVEYIATFTVIGSNHCTGDDAVYTFTVRDGGIFTLYGVKYQVFFPTTWSGSHEDTADVIITQVS